MRWPSPPSSISVKLNNNKDTSGNNNNNSNTSGNDIKKSKVKQSPTAHCLHFEILQNKVIVTNNKDTGNNNNARNNSNKKIGGAVSFPLLL